MDVILSQLTRSQLQTHSVEALHGELQQLEGVFKSAVQALQRISSVRDTAARFHVDCDDSTTLAHLARIHALHEDAAMRLDLLTAEIHMQRRDAERLARKEALPVKPEQPSAALPVEVIDCMSPPSSPAAAASAPQQTRRAVTPPPPVQLSAQPPAATPQQTTAMEIPMLLNPTTSPARSEIEIEISDSSSSSSSDSDTESDDEDIPLSALLDRHQEHQSQHHKAVNAITTTTTNGITGNSSGSYFGIGAGVESDIKPEERIQSEEPPQERLDNSIALTEPSEMAVPFSTSADQHEQEPSYRQATAITTTKKDKKKKKSKKPKKVDGSSSNGNKVAKLLNW